MKEEVRLEVASLIYFICYDRNALRRSLLEPRESGLLGGKPEEESWQVSEFWQTADEQTKKVVPMRGDSEVTLPGFKSLPLSWCW